MIKLMYQSCTCCCGWLGKTQKTRTRTRGAEARHSDNGVKVVGVILAAWLLTPGIAAAQQQAPATYDPAFVEQILKRLETQEKELKELRAVKAAEAPLDETAKPEIFPKLSFHG